MTTLKAKVCVLCGCGHLRRGIVSEIDSRGLVYQVQAMGWEANLLHGAALSLLL
ncbi:MAG: hypothetical protein N0E59_11230 [Candidatus Thiodiazotropha taylori]|nr:hypothetical protein [Candidatus Thiodiazotropha taylori]MCG7968824.1 hypothetical protein [Candidatus Thiodiazotropha taylori]MCG8028473.1 hypothetical protein [Candidatus Thiodiazotropha taylori]MCG8057801.1 hypothetical protein [Candidatus Thiodiazotropha taylori]MCG8107903.1 hypothetical protein [Candidatus Thiodiazotropha taylori]